MTAPQHWVQTSSAQPTHILIPGLFRDGEPVEIPLEHAGRMPGAGFRVLVWRRRNAADPGHHSIAGFRDSLDAALTCAARCARMGLVWVQFWDSENDAWATYIGTVTAKEATP